MIGKIAQELGLRMKQVEEAVQLLDQGNTIPFIARYRKEATGELDETVLRSIEERLDYLRRLAGRKEEVLRSIEEQGKLDEELRSQIEAAPRFQELEDIYRPYKQKKRTRASIARERGLEALATWLLLQPREGDPVKEAGKFVDEEKGVPGVDEALKGAMDIVAELVADDAQIRRELRQKAMALGEIAAKAKKEESPDVGTDSAHKYSMYHSYQEPVKKIPPHRILALNRGEKEGFLAVGLSLPEGNMLSVLQEKYLQRAGQGPCGPYMEKALKDAYKRLLFPSIEREIRSELTEKAQDQAIKVFGVNLNQLLLQPPVRGKRMLGLDPGFRTGCKWAMIDETGKLMEVGVIYPHPPQKQWEKAKTEILQAVRKFGAELIAIGNGTASRETEELVAELIRESGDGLEYIIVSEAGASVYSASPLAKEEFPDFDLSLRSAVSIARRLQDPLAELVKIEPKAIGVGQYQHDMESKKLEHSLHAVVESCVNRVGVDLNTASAALLKYVAGLNAATAKNVVAYREANGRFRQRAQLKKVPRLGEQTFVQCAGFLRLPGGDNPLENTPVHPESYVLAEKILALTGFRAEDLTKRGAEIKEALAAMSPAKLAQELQAGVPTVRDILDALQKPGRDPREDLPKPLLRKDVTKLEDLAEDMILEGTVRNVVDFGLFVDIGVKQDGLVHISQLREGFVRHPAEVAAVGDIIKVRVLSIDLARQRIALSMRETEGNNG